MKAEQLITRADGSQVKIVAELFTNPSCERTIGTYVLQRNSPDEMWHVCSDTPVKGAKHMSRSEYLRRGRCEKLRVATISEILKTVSLLAKEAGMTR